MSDAMIGLGTRVFMKELAASTSLTKLAEVFNVTLPDEQTPDVEVTNYDSAGREFIGGLPDAGEITIEMNWKPGSATDQLLSTAKGDRAVRTFRIVTPIDDDAQMYTFDGYVRSYQRGVPLDDRLTATVTIRVSGAVTQADASANPTVLP